MCSLARFRPLWSLLLLPLLVTCRPAERTPADQLTIHYTASLRGNLDGCSCEHGPAAGLVKRAVFQRGAGRDLLVLDAGDILDAFGDPELAREILEVYRELGYAAVAVGETELAAGPRELLRYARGFPLLAHNLSIQGEDGRWASLSSAPKLVKRAGVRVGLLGVTAPGLTTAADVRAADPVETVRRLAPLCREQGARLVVVLFHGPDAQARELAQACPEVDLVLFGHQGWIVPPEKVGGALLASPGELGNRVGELTLQLGPDGASVAEHRLHTFSYAKDPDDPAVRKRVRAYRQKLQERLRSEDLRRED